MFFCIYLSCGIQFPRRTCAKAFSPCFLNHFLFQWRAVDGSQKDGCQSWEIDRCYISYPWSLPGSRAKKGAKVPVFDECIQDACVLVFVLVLMLVSACVWPSVTTAIKTQDHDHKGSIKIVVGTTFQSNNIKYIKCSCTHLVSHARGNVSYSTVLGWLGLFLFGHSTACPIHPMDLRKQKNLAGKTKGTVSLC